ncbi:MAG: acsA 1 [Ramlibacter sp.]|nr:acsA 1 [Ramlibacter sp.]
MTFDLARYAAFLKKYATNGPASGGLSIALCDRHAESAPDSLALMDEAPDGTVTTYSYAKLRELSTRFANALAARGVRRGDRVALFLGQTPEMPIALIAAWRLAAIAMPIASVFSGTGLLHRLAHSGAKGIVTDRTGYAKLQPLLDQLPPDMTIWLTDGTEAGTANFWSDVAKGSTLSPGVPGQGRDPAYIIYTSGTTGKAKGVVHSHGGWLGGVGGLAMIHTDLGTTGDVAWSPAEWTWIAGFSGILLSFLYAGTPLVSWKAPHPFDPDAVFAFMSRHKIRNTLLTPTMLRMMRQVRTPPPTVLRSLFCTGESLGKDMFEYLQSAFGLIPGEAYGQTECAPFTVHNAALMPARFGSLGLGVPGARLQIVNAAGEPVKCGEVGEIASHRSHPQTFLGYWGDEAATAAKLRGEWLLTGDEAWQDEEGYLWFVGRNDDIIKSSGYRIGPSDIEACFATHPAVDLVAVVGLPDEVRGEAVTAVVQLKPGVEPSETLSSELVEYGRTRLERHEYPRRIEFMAQLPLTVTGKVMRKAIKDGLWQRGAARA